MVSLKDWMESIWGTQGQIQSANQTLPSFSAIESLETYYNSLPEDVRKAPSVEALYLQRKVELKDVHVGTENPITKFIQGALDEWLKKVEEYGKADPEKAKENLSRLSAHVIEVAAASAVVDYTMGIMPNGLGQASSTNTKEILKWLGFSAVLAAVAHDPVKIGLLRPYQDALESTFRNKRPDHISVMQSYTQRSLSPTRIEDPDKITDELMKKVEDENDKKFDEEMAKHGYNEWFINVLKDTSTKTLTFSNLAQLAKMGHYNRGLATYSLWGMGLDRRLMKSALDTLDQMDTVSKYEGFRALIEPAYVEGDIDEKDLREYYTRIKVPVEVQNWAIARLSRRRASTIAKQAGSAAVKAKDLTVSNQQQLYEYGKISRAEAQNRITAMGYSTPEAKDLLDLADIRKKSPAVEKLKRLPLTDYEKAYKNGLISQEAVLARMKDEYSQEDIDLERRLLEIGKA